MKLAALPSPSFVFGRCQVSVQRRELLREGRPVSLGGRAFDILVALVEGRGGVVTKDDLILRAWPGRIVEENTLEAQISALRRALGEDRTVIRTVAGRGYQFVAEIADGLGAPEAERVQAASPVASAVRALPMSVTPLIGREAALREIVDLAASSRLITLVGAGGVGKTRLAIEAARSLAAGFPDGVSIAELGPVGAAEFLPATVAEALGFPQGAGTPSLDRIASAINHRRMLLVLDNCEHLVDAAAQITEKLLRAGPFVSVIATSREALKVDGEYVYRVASLDVPGEEVRDVDQLLAFGALQLFDARAASAGGEEYAGRAPAAELKARICRHLDGIPLAIELAAARVRVFGLEGVADRIDDRFNLLTGGARTALPRQKTLRATLDWSYELLSEQERQVLGRLGVFSGSFSIESAAAVASSASIPPVTVVECLSQLVEKSLIAADGATRAKYRLLETTQVYAREKMQSRGVLGEYSLRHAQHHRDLFVRAEIEWETLPTAEWVARYAGHLEGLRAAVNWSFSPEGDASLGVSLTTSAVSLWIQFGLLEECLARVNQALAHLDDEEVVDSRSRMKLYAAKGASLLYQGVGSETGAAFRRALDYAERLGDDEYRLRAIWGTWSVTYLNGSYEASLALARRFSALADARPHKADRLIGSRMTGMSLLCLGRLGEARDGLQRVTERYEAPVRRSHQTRFIYEQKTIALSSLAHTLWLQGFPEQAMRAAQQAVEGARALDHAPSICYALTEGLCAITVLTGGVSSLGDPAAAAVAATRRHGISTWKARGRMWNGLLALGTGDTLAYERDLRPAFDEIGEALYVLHYTGFVSAVCEALGQIDREDEGIELATAGIERARRFEDRCSLSELLRAKANLMGRRSETSHLAEALLVEAVETSRQHDARGWRLRCATSLAGLWMKEGRLEDARGLLRPVYEEFSEGFDTRDLRAARRLLEAMR
ncbi:winged helix-turn-helix domain-containing protein [Variovorax sp. J31P207]|uniref:ATP-binding protein n=1 Tax=Variovorax sp. J31P207 TaxID=3053510 RepID=UPI0025767AAA|nr:winged helix-turn-helix domain-containing protein [Variovorax sp. J31P207]MDM0069601.1 winged helix-turn-helix domain-containing protein [Variovorax sp. J31P207]